MPIRRFWLLHKNVDRLAAEESIRTATIGASVQSGEGMQTLMAGLKTQMGKVAVIDEAARANSEQLDRTGLHALKAINKAR